MERPVRLAVCGSVDVSKSTTLGRLKTGIYDDGNGKVRDYILHNAHEKRSGRTSSVTRVSIPTEFGSIDCVDLCGHSEYLKTTLFGLTATCPDYVMLMAAGNKDELPVMFTEHFLAASALRLPIILVITKIDFAPKKVLETLLGVIKKFATRIGRKLFMVRKESDLEIAKQSVQTVGVIPVFLLSNIDPKENKSLAEIQTRFSQFLYQLHVPELINVEEKRDDVFWVDSRYKAKGYPLIVGGRVHSGTINENDTYYIGPYGGKVRKIVIKGIHTEGRDPVDQLKTGWTGCLALRARDEVEYEDLTPGLIITSNENVQFTTRFRATIAVFKHSCSMKIGYQPFMHCFALRKITEIEEINKDEKILRSGDEESVIMSLKGEYAYLEVGMRFILREGKIRAAGIITELL